VLAWGNNRVGGLGNGTYSGLGSGTPNSDSLSPIPVLDSNGVDLLTDIVAIALGSGSRTAYAQKSDGTLVAWGANFLGQYGNGTYWGSNVPVPVIGLASLPDIVDPHDKQLKPAITAVSKGQTHSMALMGDGTVMSWGSAGSNGNGTLANQYTPAPVLDVDGVGILGAYPKSPIVAVSGGGSNDLTADLSLALDKSGQVFAWGGNALGGLSQPLTTTISLIPVKVNGLPPIRAIAAGHGFGLALADDGTGNVWAWGRGSNGQLGNGVTPLPNWTFNEATSQITPARVLSADRVTPLTGVTAIAVGAVANSFVIQGANRALLAFGANDQPQSNVPGGALGIGSVINQSFPVPVMDTDGVTPLVNVVAFSGSGENSYAVKADGTLLVWGENNFGNYGNGTFGFSTASTIPVKVSMPDTGSPVINVVAGGHFATALKADGSVYSWGHNNILGGGLNSNGSLGDGTFNDRYIPGQVYNLGRGSGVVSIAPASCNPIHMLALQRLPGFSTVFGWGPEYDSSNMLWGALGTGAVTFLPAYPVSAD
jgi:alpha-tubulin suppressor-like RCC1 family protein